MRPRKPPKKAVVGDLHTLQCRYVISCMVCGYKRVFTPSEAVATFGFNLPIAKLRTRITCSSCDAPYTEIRMRLHDGDVIAMHKREGLVQSGPEDLKTRSPGGPGKYPQRTRESRLSWQGDLAAMKEAGTLVFSTCSTCKEHHEAIDLDQLIGLYGPETDLWDRWSECPTIGCGGKAFFLASTGPGTPARPLMTSLTPDPWIDEAVALDGAIRRKAG